MLRTRQNWHALLFAIMLLKHEFHSEVIPILLRCSLILIVSWLCIASVFATETLTVAVASSLYSTLERQATAFEKKHDVQIKLISGSTGRLYNQIQLGAPFDIFVAAEEQRPNILVEEGKAFGKHMLGYGHLGLIIDHQHSEDVTKLLSTSVQHIAIANPNVAPFGKACKKLLQQKKLWQTLKSKLVYAQNAMQASMMVEQGLVDAGFVPVYNHTPYLLRIPYVGVLLSHRAMAKQYLLFIKKHD